jgi:hypothetical protein
MRDSRGQKGRRTECECLSEWEWRVGKNADHIVEPGRRELCHHRLGKGVVRCLEKAKDNVVSPVRRQHGDDRHKGETTYQNSQTLWKPSLVVQMPIMPHKGIIIVTTFVTTNYLILVHNFAADKS